MRTLLGLFGCDEPRREQILPLVRALASSCGALGSAEPAARLMLVADTPDPATDPPP